MKTCTKCGELKDLQCFYKSKNGKYGRRGDCKSCIYKISRLPENVQKSREYNRLYRKTEKWKIYMKEYRKRTGNARVWVKKYSDKKKTDPVYIERRKLQKKKYYESESFKLLRGTVQYKLKVVIRSRLNIAIKQHIKSGSSVKDLGCSIEELKTYLESKFKPGMSWENWSHDGWHIDHIKPLSSFNLSDRRQFLEACNHKNLQPLWAKENFSKGCKV